jgi:hypothetical protein
VYHEQAHHFVAASHWPTEPAEQVLAQQLVGSHGAILIMDDTTLPEQGH